MAFLRWRKRNIGSFTFFSSSNNKYDTRNDVEDCVVENVMEDMSNETKNLNNNKASKLTNKQWNHSGTNKKKSWICNHRMSFILLFLQIVFLGMTIMYIDKIKTKVVSMKNYESIQKYDQSDIPPKSNIHNEVLVLLGERSHEHKSIDSTESLLKNSNLLYGARYTNGTKGYIADAKYVRNSWYKKYSNQNNSFIPMSSIEKSKICDVALGQSITELSNGHKILMKVEVAKEQEYNTYSPRVLCAIYTISTHEIQMQNIIDTWGHKCDGFVAFSNATDVSLGAIDLIHLGPETYTNIWQKVRSIWAYVYENYRDEYDFFHLCGDDTFLVVENLRYFLSAIMREYHESTIDNDNIDHHDSYPYPLYLGEWFPIQSAAYKLQNVPPKSVFCGGGSGYTLNRYALQKLIQVLPTCLHDVTMMPSEDTFIGYCLLQVDITPNSTIDNYNEQMYHGRHVNYIYDGYKPDNSAWHKVIHDFYNDYYFNTTMKNATFKSGRDAASIHSIAFHRMWDEYSMKRHHAIIHKTTCDVNTTIGQQLLSAQHQKSR